VTKDNISLTWPVSQGFLSLHKPAHQSVSFSLRFEQPHNRSSHTKLFSHFQLPSSATYFHFHLAFTDDFDPTHLGHYITMSTHQQTEPTNSPETLSSTTEAETDMSFTEKADETNQATRSKPEGISSLPFEMIEQTLKRIRSVDDYFNFLQACPVAYRVHKTNEVTNLFGVLGRSRWSGQLRTSAVWTPIGPPYALLPGTGLTKALARQRRVERGQISDEVAENEGVENSWVVSGDEDSDYLD
jgi:hypothetical protein